MLVLGTIKNKHITLTMTDINDAYYLSVWADIANGVPPAAAAFISALLNNKDKKG